MQYLKLLLFVGRTSFPCKMWSMYVLVTLSSAAVIENRWDEVTTTLKWVWRRVPTPEFNSKHQDAELFDCLFRNTSETESI